MTTTLPAREARRQLTDNVKALLIDALDLDLTIEEIADDGPLFGFGLGLDSIDALTLVVSLETRFDIEIADADVDLCQSVNRIADLLETRMSQC